MIYIYIRSNTSNMQELIIKHNPWWRGLKDYTLEEWNNMKVKWIPEWIDDISLNPFSLNFVFGPRQVGKTTGLKLLVNRLLRENDPMSILYFNCDFLTDTSSLRKLLDWYLEFRKSYDIASSYIFLDEITSIQEWWRIIKGYIDLGVFEDDVLTLSGSSSWRLRGSMELFPGRRGTGRDIVVMPLSFREFLLAHGININLTGDWERDMKRLMINEEIEMLFDKYILSGGFPLPMNDDPTAETTFIKALEGEILRLDRRMHIVKAITSAIFDKAPSPLSYSTIGRDIGVSYKTVEDYLDVLRNLYILDLAYFKNGRNIIWRKEKKIFFIDPFIARTLSYWSGTRYLESAFYEWIVQSHLLRKYSDIYYYRNSYEVDCIADNLYIEVKIGKPHRKYPKKVYVINREQIPFFIAAIV